MAPDSRTTDQLPPRRTLEVLDEHRARTGRGEVPQRNADATPSRLMRMAEKARILPVGATRGPRA